MSAPGLAAFDFDGTLVPGDSFLSFLVRLRGPGSTALQLLASTAPRLVRNRMRLDRDASKADLVRRLLSGYAADRLETESEAFASALVARIRSDMRARIDWHANAGHVLLIVSASPDCYLGPVGRQLGFNDVLATKLEVGPDSCLTGRLEGANCRGAEKERRLRAWVGDHLRGQAGEVWAYGNSAGDREMMAAADHPFRVSRRTIQPAAGPASRPV